MTQMRSYMVGKIKWGLRRLLYAPGGTQIPIPAVEKNERASSALVIAGGACCLYGLLDTLYPNLSYFYGALLKQLVFWSALLLYMVITRDLHVFRRMLRPAGRQGIYRPGLLLGTLAFVIILGGSTLYLALFDTQALRMQIDAASKSQSNFIPVALYIIFGNTLLEEIFFRGFVFMTLAENGSRRFAHLFSAMLFAVYHLYVFNATFPPILVFLSMLGLALCGYFLDRMNVRATNILNSWTAHFMGSVAIMLLGLYLYGYFGAF